MHREIDREAGGAREWEPWDPVDLGDGHFESPFIEALPDMEGLALTR
jgi:hypothetical protein